MARKKAIVSSLLGVAIVAVGFGAYNSYGSTAATANTVTTTTAVKKGIVLQSVTASGNVTAPIQVSASFAQTGKVFEIMVKQGDVVTAGQALARIEDTTQQAALTVAKNSQTATQATIDKTNAGLTAADKAQLDSGTKQSSNGVANAQSALDSANSTLSQDTATLQSAVDNAQTSLDKTNAQLATDTASQTEDRIAYIASQVINDPSKPAGESINATTLRLQADQDVCTAKATPTDGVVCSGLNPMLRMFQAANAQDRTVIASQAAVTQASTGVANATANQANGLNKDNLNIVNSQRLLDSAKLSYQATLAANAVKVSGPTADVVAQQRNQILQAQSAIDTAQKNVDDTVLKAPVAGTITAVNGTVGLLSSATGSTSSSGGGGSSSNAFISIVDLTKLQVKGGFAEADAAKVKAGLIAKVTFDALPNVTATGTVTSIDSLATVSSNVVTYNVILTLDNAPATVKPGMTATMAVGVDHRDGVLLLPTAAVTGRGTNANLTIRAKNGKESVVRATIGLRGDDSVEITAGLNLGDLVVIRTTIAGGGSTVRAGQTGTAGIATGGAAGGGGFGPPGG